MQTKQGGYMDEYIRKSLVINKEYAAILDTNTERANPGDYKLRPLALR